MSEAAWGPQYDKNVMFLCNHNSCRSQMADGWLQLLRGDRSIGVASAGIVGGTAVKPGAITVMKEVGIDISDFTSDAMADFHPADFDIVISCCGCGSKLGGENEAWKKRAKFADWNLDDPPAIDPGDLSAYRRVRDQTRERVLRLLEEVAPTPTAWQTFYELIPFNRHHAMKLLCYVVGCILAIAAYLMARDLYNGEYSRAFWWGGLAMLIVAWGGLIGSFIYIVFDTHQRGQSVMATRDEEPEMEKVKTGKKSR